MSVIRFKDFLWLLFTLFSCNYIHWPCEDPYVSLNYSYEIIFQLLLTSALWLPVDLAYRSMSWNCEWYWVGFVKTGYFRYITCLLNHNNYNVMVVWEVFGVIQIQMCTLSFIFIGRPSFVCVFIQSPAIELGDLLEWACPFICLVILLWLPCIFEQTAEGMYLKLGAYNRYGNSQIWLINFWLCSIEFPPFPDLWFFEQFPRISGQIIEEVDRKLGEDNHHLYSPCSTNNRGGGY